MACRQSPEIKLFGIWPGATNGACTGRAFLASSHRERVLNHYPSAGATGPTMAVISAHSAFIQSLVAVMLV